MSQMDIQVEASNGSQSSFWNCRAVTNKYTVSEESDRQLSRSDSKTLILWKLSDETRITELEWQRYSQWETLSWIDLEVKAIPIEVYKVLGIRSVWNSENFFNELHFCVVLIFSLYSYFHLVPTSLWGCCIVIGQRVVSILYFLVQRYPRDLSTIWWDSCPW